MLFAAIFREAVRSDYIRIENTVEEYCDRRDYPYRLVRKTIQSEKEYIKKQIADYVYKESHEYPYNSIRIAHANRLILIKYLINKIKRT